ncbi:hypothetical protein GINT2_001808 [Glugoides intestinalis]
MKKNLKAYRTSKKLKEGEICINLKKAGVKGDVVDKKSLTVLKVNKDGVKGDVVDKKSLTVLEVNKDGVKGDVLAKKPLIKLPKRSLTNNPVEENSAMNGKYKALVRGYCLKFSIPFTPSINAMTDQFFKERLIKLEFINEQMMDVYAKAMLYCAVSKRTGMTQKMIIGKTRKEIFKKALNEVEDFKFIEEERGSENTLICNLYKIKTVE